MPISDGTALYTYRETEILALLVARATAFFEAAGLGLLHLYLHRGGGGGKDPSPSRGSG